MKIALVVAAGAAALMSGCATTTPTGPTVAQASVADNVDYARVAAINAVARTQGVVIQWIHYPQNKKVSVGVAPTLADPST